MSEEEFKGQNSDKSSEELSDDELKDVAGGAPHYSDYSGTKFKAGAAKSKYIELPVRDVDKDFLKQDQKK